MLVLVYWSWHLEDASSGREINSSACESVHVPVFNFIFIDISLSIEYGTVRFLSARYR